MTQIETIKSKLEELKKLDRRCSIFGSERHRYQWNVTLGEQEIRQLEEEHNILLSEEYRNLIQYFGNGGAGCGYGLEKLSLKHIHPPYPGTTYLLRNCDTPERMDIDMVELDEISGYIKLFDYGCGIETDLVVNGPEQGALIFFDSDGAFRKIKGKSLLGIYEDWLDDSLSAMKNVKTKLMEMSVTTVITTEWELENFNIKEMIYSIMDIDQPPFKPHTDDYKTYMEVAQNKWMNALPAFNNKSRSSTKKWWQFWES